MVRRRCLCPCATGRARARLDGHARPSLACDDDIHLCHATPRATWNTCSKPWSPAACAWPRPHEVQRAWPAWPRPGAVRPHAPPARRAHGRRAAARQPRQRRPAGLRRRTPAPACHRKRRARCALRHRRAVDGDGWRRCSAVPYGHEAMARLADAARPARLGPRAAHRLHAAGRRQDNRGAPPGHGRHLAAGHCPCDSPCSTWTTRCSAATATCCGATSWCGVACWTRASRERNRTMASAYTAGSVTPADYCNFYAGTLAGHGESHWQPMRERFLARGDPSAHPRRRTRAAAAAPRRRPHAGADHRHQPRRQRADRRRPGRGPLPGHRGGNGRRAVHRPHAGRAEHAHRQGRAAARLAAGARASPRPC